MSTADQSNGVIPAHKSIHPFAFFWRDGLATTARFLLIYAVPVSLMYGCLTGSEQAIRLVGRIFLLILLLDMLLPTPANAGPGAELFLTGCRRLALWLWVPTQVAVILCGLVAVSRSTETGWALFDFVLMLSMAVGMVGGMWGLTFAHELMHRTSFASRGLAFLLMTILSYGHFCIEHVLGHHRRVATPEDPATARLGESLYAFLPRTVFGGLVSAWRLESRRLRRRGRAPWHPANRMLRYLMLLTFIYVSVGLAFGWLGLVFFTAQGIVAFSILETLNYIQHYGLRRRRTATGYEPVTPSHSWSSTHRASNFFMLNIGYHGDHHHRATRAYSALSVCPNAPRMPGGYMAMFVLAFFPPLWRRIMDPLVSLWQEPDLTGAGSRCDHSEFEQGTGERNTVPVPPY